MADYDTSEYVETVPQNGAESTQQNNAVEQTNQGMGDASQEATKIKPGDKIHASKDEDDGTKLFVGGLSWETDQASLIAYFKEFGTVVDAIVKTEVDVYGQGGPSGVPGKSRGFGFVKFGEAAAVDKILAKKDGHTIDRKVVDCKKALPLKVSKEPRVKKLFVGGLPNEVTEEQLRDYFGKFGTISEDKGPVKGITLPKDPNNQKRRGFAFIVFDDEDSVDKITTKQFHDIAEHQVEVKKALPQQEHQARQMGMNYRGGFFGARGRGGGRGGRGGGYGGNSGYSPSYYGGQGGYGYGGYGQGGYEGYSGYGQGGYGGYGSGGYGSAGGNGYGGYDYSQDYNNYGQYGSGGGYGGYDFYSDYMGGVPDYKGRSGRGRRGKTP